MDPQDNSRPPDRLPIHPPEARYRCAGEYCPTPGYVHQAQRLFLDTNVFRPGFFCATCRPKPMLPGTPVPQTLAGYLEQATPDPTPTA